MFKKDGAVTVFAVVVLSALLLFFGVLIDYARIAATEKLSEDAARAAARSVLSAYDAYLYERYGLFGRGGTEGGEIFRSVLEGNRGEAASGAGFGLLRTRVEGAELHVASVLGQHEVFARGVLEEMKYKAPIDFTLDVVSKFTALAEPLKEASSAISTLERLRKLYEQRERHLEQVLRLQRQAADAAGASEALEMVPVEPGLGGSGHAASFIERYGEYSSQKLHDSSLPGDEEPAFADEIASYEAEAAELARQLRWQGSRLERSHAELMSKAADELEKAEQLNRRMQAELERAQSVSRPGYGQVADSGAPGAEKTALPDGAAGELAQLRESGGELVLPESWFADYGAELQTQGADNVAFTGALELLAARLSAGIGGTPSEHAHRAMTAALADAKRGYAKYASLYIQPGSRLEERQRILSNGDLKSRLKRQESETQAKWTQARNMLNGFASLPDQEEYVKQFQQVRERYEQNLRFNQQADTGGPAAAHMPSGDAHDAAEQSAGVMDGLFAGMGNMLERSRDTIYYGEYAIGKFASFDPTLLRDLLESGDKTAVSQAVSFHRQEAEYVIYGFHSPLGNIAAAYGELFAFRLAVRTMEGLIASRSLGHPLLVLSAAIAYGLEKTMEDMLSFVRKGSAPLSKYAKVELTYADYLRLFMLLHGGSEEKRLARMVAVIEQNSGLTLSEVPTGVTGEARISARLWFLPGVMSLLGRFNLLEGKVKGNRYETATFIGWSY